MKKRTLILFLAVIIAVMFTVHCKKEASPGDADPAESTAQPVKPEDPSDSKVVLQVNQNNYTNGDFKAFLLVQYPDIYDSASRQDEKNNVSNGLISRLFDSFVEHKVVSCIAAQHAIPLEERELDDYIAQLKLRQKDAVDRDAVKDALKVQKFLHFKVYDPVEVADTEIKSYYKKHMEDFRKKTEVFLHQILVKDREKAIKIRGMLDNEPRKFEELARGESISMEAQNGGEMGYFEEGTLPKDMEKVVFSLPLNSISPVVESAYGYHIFKVTKKKKGRLLFYKNVEAEIRDHLMSEKLRLAYREFLERAQQDLKIVMKHQALFFPYEPPGQGAVDGNDSGDDQPETDPVKEGPKEQAPKT